MRATISLLIAYLNSLFFKIVLTRLIKQRWRSSTIAKWNENNKKAPCHYCFSEETAEFNKIYIDSAFGLFDKNKNSLSLYYGTWIPQLIWDYLGVLRVNYIKKVSHNLGDIQKNKVFYLDCQKCGIIFQNYPHKQVNISNYYDKYYRRQSGSTFGRADSSGSGHVKLKELIASTFLKETGLMENSLVLDVGCAEGIFCSALNSSGMIPYGVELSQPMIAYGQEILMLNNLKNESYNSSTYPSKMFDAIHCFQVLEHILDIDNILKSMSKHIKSNGILSISVPCADLASNESDLSYTLCSDHIYNFTEKWFQSNLPSYGFKIFTILKSAFDLEQYGSENPGSPFNASPWGGPRGSIWVFAKKIK
jgi:2-polyprenyl-3-methyl-5-hydroxy-6-metoxy-1,4-benzoquinol methylase